MRVVLISCLLYSMPLLHAQERDQRLQITYQRNDSTLIVYADSQVPYPQSVFIEFKFKGLAPESPLKDHYLIESEASRKRLIVFRLPENRSWSFNYKYTFYQGDVEAEHDSSYVYRIPLGTQKSYAMTQGYNGQYSHQGKKALDFTIPEGTEVFAARGGLVIDIREDSDSGCGDESCVKMGNYIKIMHDDGTIADYFHLQFNGALVEPGQRVKTGEKIGLSGSTGWASGPHLHFMVYKYGKEGQESFPTLFQYDKDKVGYLVEGRSYKGIAVNY